MKSGNLIAILGILIGVPGFLSYFSPDRIVVGIAIALLIALIILVYSYINLPLFTITSMSKELVIHDAEAKRATLTRTQVAISNHRGASEFWCRNISADGSITNIRIDGREPDAKRIEAGDIQVCRRFQNPLGFRERFTTTLSYDLDNSFPGATEGVIHVVEGRTARLRISVRMPSQRPARNQRACLRFGGQVHKQVQLTTSTPTSMELEVRRPRLGAEYLLEWDW